MGNDETYKAVRWVLEVSLFLSAEMIAYGELPTESGRLPTHDIVSIQKSRMHDLRRQR